MVITGMNYEKLDLNLLYVFNAVMTELHVTRAAQRLHMTQPAVSNALNRLRRALDDELFVKVPTGVRPTPKAMELWQPIRDALTQIRQALEAAEFDPAIASATFRIAMNDFAAHLLLPKLATVVEALAPNVSVRTLPVASIDAETLLEQADIDLAIGVFTSSNARLRSRSLLTSPFTCVMRRGHPLASQTLTLNRYIQAKHLLVTLTGEATGFIDVILQERQLERRVVFTVNQFTVVPQIIASSDLIAVLPARTIGMSAFSEQLHSAPLPLEISPSIIKMMWHERNQLDSAQVWLRAQLIALCEQL